MTYWRLPTSWIAHINRECLGKSAKVALSVGGVGKYPLPICKRCLARQKAAA